MLAGFTLPAQILQAEDKGREIQREVGRTVTGIEIAQGRSQEDLTAMISRIATKTSERIGTHRPEDVVLWLAVLRDCLGNGYASVDESMPKAVGMA